jgi:hypothetical protein
MRAGMCRSLPHNRIVSQSHSGCSRKENLWLRVVAPLIDEEEREQAAEAQSKVRAVSNYRPCRAVSDAVPPAHWLACSVSVRQQAKREGAASARSSASRCTLGSLACG